MLAWLLLASWLVGLAVVLAVGLAVVLAVGLAVGLAVVLAVGMAVVGLLACWAGCWAGERERWVIMCRYSR